MSGGKDDGNDSSPEEIFKDTMKSMKIVMDPLSSQAAIYYHDEVKNVAKLLVEQIAFFKFKDNSEFIQNNNLMV